MAIKEEIGKAMSCHARWKDILRQAIDIGLADTPVSSVGSDNKCEFGQWLYGDSLSLQDKQSACYQKVRALHAEFHREAARIVELAQMGDKAGAEHLMRNGGEYASVSALLTMALIEWKRSLRQT